MNSAHRKAFLVVGGGIGGLTAALALARAGHQVRVLERAPEFSEIGAGLQLGPNASRVLDRLGILDMVTVEAFFPNRLALRSALTGAQLTHLETGDAFQERFGYRYLVTHRADLHRAIRTACEQTGLVELMPGKDVTGIEAQRDGVTVQCADGTTYSTQALVAADGLHSPIRAALIGDGAPKDSGYVAYRGTAPIAALAQHGGLREPDGMVIWAGPGLHLVQYPVRRGELVNQVAVVDISLYLENLHDPAAHLSAAFANACSEVRAGIALIDTTRRWPLLDREPATGWSRDAITLVGDAAHPMLQYLAQGACQAIEDAVVLADRVTEYSGSIEGAFRAYESERAPRTARVQSTARRWGEILHIDGIGVDLRAALLAELAPDDYRLVEWVYGFDPNARTPDLSA